MSHSSILSRWVPLAGSLLLGACAPELCVGDCAPEDTDGAASGGTAPDATVPDELLPLLSCNVQSTIDDSTCGDGVSQPGELCFASVTRELSGQSVTAVSGDFDGDGLTDLVWTDLENLNWARGAVDDPLSDMVVLMPTDPGRPVLLTGVGDFDANGTLDLVASDDRPLLLSGDGLGGFEPAQVLHEGSSWGPFVMDDDGDGDLDLMLIDGGLPLDNAVLDNDGSGVFTLVPLFDDGDDSILTPTITGDLDGESPGDRVTGIDDTVRIRARGALGDTVSILTLAADYFRARMLRVADLDGDGHADLVVNAIDRVHRDPDDLAIYDSLAIFLSQGPPVDGTPVFDQSTYLPMDCAMRGLELDDIDGDGDIDIVASHDVAPDQSRSLVVRLNDGQGGFDSVIRIPAPPEAPRASSIMLGDFDGDGRRDVVQLADQRLLLFRGTD